MKAFADRHVSGGTPAIVRVLGAGNAFRVESDPRSEAFQGYRTASDIGPHLVLGSEHNPPRRLAKGSVRSSAERAWKSIANGQAHSCATSNRIPRTILSGKVQPDHEDEPDDFYD